MMIDGVETLVGVNSYSDEVGCIGAAHYRRADLYRDFIDEFVPPPPVPEGGGSAAGGRAGTGGNDEGSDDESAEAEGCSLSWAPRGSRYGALFAALCAVIAERRRRAVLC